MKQEDYIYGKNACKEALKGNQTITNCLISKNFNDFEIINLIKKRNIPYEKVENAKLDKMFTSHQGIALKLESYKYFELDTILNEVKDKKDALVVLLDGLEDPHNLGAIIRSCDIFNVDAIIIPTNRSVSITPSVVKISTGAIEYVKVCKVTNLNQAIEKLKRNGFWIVASDGLASTFYDELDYKMKTGLIIGSEGKGISPLTLKNADYIVKIPMKGHVNSLNASVATGIILAMIDYKRGK